LKSFENRIERYKDLLTSNLDLSDQFLFEGKQLLKSLYLPACIFLFSASICSEIWTHDSWNCLDRGTIFCHYVGHGKQCSGHRKLNKST